ncbi:MAG TPA: hypothetical protein VFV67_21220 [Actinophytocola sp.]|uniref:hypothetical protein n=1 Tax=Actinophytocola sp. TaxID=1872138 RepID=UPI002DB55F8A|nr:hypothetical protein [Actinophytocola sp.]HEU5473173.1 hypothetical protein [Actinophytocola sp.]
MIPKIGRRGRRVRRALESARVIDQVVNNQLALVPRLTEEGRRRAAEYLAELVMLAQAYRHFAAGWITRRELERRGLRTVRRLGALRQRRGRSAAHFTERE